MSLVRPVRFYPSLLMRKTTTIFKLLNNIERQEVLRKIFSSFVVLCPNLTECIQSVLDSVGIGAAPANDFVNASVPDGASDTLGHISKSVGLNVPNMAAWSRKYLRETPLKQILTESNPTGYATKLQEVSLGKA